MAAVAVAAQTYDGDVNLSGGRLGLDRPASLAVSAAGDQIAVTDPHANRIAVLDYQGRLLWSCGDKINLGQPLAAAFLSDDELLFSGSNACLLLKISRDNATVLDTVADLTSVMGDRRRIDQLLRTRDGNWIVLDRTDGRVLLFDQDWKLIDNLIGSGSGKGKLLVPTGMMVTGEGRIIITDRKNYPAQLFSAEGSFLFNFGWNNPATERGWEATAVAVDSRTVIWIADETGARFRQFDAAGAEIGSVDFPNPLFHPIAMCGTIDNRMMVLDDRGRLVFYALQ